MPADRGAVLELEPAGQREQLLEVRAAVLARLWGALARELGAMKGAIMKVGQMLSMQSNELSPEWIEALSNLQMQSATPFLVLARRLEHPRLGTL